MAARTHFKFQELPLSAIRPAGWLRRMLEKQRDGLTGHLEEGGYPFNTPGWAAPKVTHKHSLGWWPYEQNGYWVDGMMRCGALLGDRFLVQKANKQIDYTLRHQDRDGYLGPKHMKKRGQGNRWAHAVFFRSLMARFSAFGEKALLRALSRHYLSNTCPHSDGRETVNVEVMAWLYARTGDQRLRRMALKAFGEADRKGADQDYSLKGLLSSRKSTIHGVSYMELGKLPAIIYGLTGERRMLRASQNGFKKLDRDHMLVDGVPSSSEMLCGKDPLASHETCDIADYTWSAGYLLMATGDGTYADKIERACFNAAPGAIKKDFKALQYLSCPNQAIAATHSNHNPFERGKKFMAFGPNPVVECCPANVNRIFPNYVSRMWMSDGQGGLVAAMYGPSEITARAGGDNIPVTITEETDYPFSGMVALRIQTASSARFPLYLRVPSWCRKPELSLNGSRVAVTAKPGEYFRLEREFKNGDCLRLRLPAEIRSSRWPARGVAVERGPLVFSLGIREKWAKKKPDAKSSRDFPNWNLFPGSAWSFGLAAKSGPLKKAVLSRSQAGLDPWSLESAPLKITLPARRLKGWKLVQARKVLRGYPGQQKEVKGNFIMTPPLPRKRRPVGKPVNITLVPYGCTHLRITVFPAI